MIRTEYVTDANLPPTEAEQRAYFNARPQRLAEELERFKRIVNKWDRELARLNELPPSKRRDRNIMVANRRRVGAAAALGFLCSI